MLLMIINYIFNLYFFICFLKSHIGARSAFRKHHSFSSFLFTFSNRKQAVVQRSVKRQHVACLAGTREIKPAAVKELTKTLAPPDNRFVSDKIIFLFLRLVFNIPSPPCLLLSFQARILLSSFPAIYKPSRGSMSFFFCFDV